MKKLDFIILGVFIVLSLLGIILINRINKTGLTCTVYLKGEIYGKYSLNEEQCVDILVDGKKINTLDIKSGKVGMVFADCPDKICINQGYINDTSNTICCAPNNVIVVINADDDQAGKYDAITQ